MRILAIIPACEGSTIFPNKNMRVLRGKPMIYYVINNAKNSKYITDIIVTTNSREILTLSKRMGVLYRDRDPKLSSSSISLDTVIYDVFNQLNKDDYDAIITLQSISPLLKAETLDKAIEKFIKEDYDSLISVKNQPHFYWEMVDNKPYPLQEKRMNRHMLPPFYMETGAFLIIKPQFVNEDSRIGKNIGLYELEGDEALDVNNFADLESAENALNRKSTAIFVNGNSEIGLGHISRVLQVADELFTKPDIYFDNTITDKKDFGDTKHKIIGVKGLEGLCNELKKKHYDIIINDILNTSKEYMGALREVAQNSKIINFEDAGEGASEADIVVNALYENENNPKVRNGSDYFIIPKLFLLYEPITINDRVKNVIVTFGGADPQNYTESVLEIAKDVIDKDIKFTVIIGKANKNFSVFITRYSKYDNIKILYDVDNIVELFSQSDVAITSRGRTCLELASLGVPTISIAQHAREELHTFASPKNGFVCLKPNSDKSLIQEELMKLINSSKEERLKMQKEMIKNDLRNGRKNVAKIIQNG